MLKRYFYITTTLPYVNADPHIGFALEILQADTLARYHKLLGDIVFFNTGTDEHGLKIYEQALKEHQKPQKYADKYADKFNNLKLALNLSYNSFIRTTDKHHIKAAKEFWKRCLDNGDIYKAKQKIKYCVGCELEKTASELVNAKCPIHPNKKIIILEEENYFFKFSKYQSALLKLYKKNSKFVLPVNRLQEIKNFVAKGLKDFSISRLKKKMPWGIEVPGDPSHIQYVWFDALINYISCLGWPESEKEFKQWWPGLQVAGKDNLRQQSAMWQAMLMSAGLPTSKQILIHGFITSDGQKMSKSLGNVIDPFHLAKKYGTDPLRYYLLKDISPFEDGDFTINRFEKIYNSDLANGLGNLIQRVLTLLEKFYGNKIPAITENVEKLPLQKSIELKTWKKYNKFMGEHKFNEALFVVWKFIGALDKYIDKQKPWEMAKNQEDKKLAITVFDALESLHQIAWMIYPFMPETAREMGRRLGVKPLTDKNPLVKNSFQCIQSGKRIIVGTPLFPRI